MTIAILGWYHRNNAGDDRILECINKKLSTYGTIDTVVFVAWEDLKTKISKINNCDFLLVGGGGLILRSTNRLVDDFKNITIDWAFFGVSVDSVGADNKLFIDHIANHAKFILVRDDFSYNVFKTLQNAKIYQAPDLTFLYPYKPSEVSAIENKVSLSLRPWKPNLFKQFTKNYYRFNHLVHKFPFLIKLPGFWNEQRFVKLLKTNDKLIIKPFPLYFDKTSGDDKIISRYFEVAEDDSFDIEILKNSSYLIGMRLHSLIFATQLGIPFIAMNYASKVKNYSALVGMSKYVLELKYYHQIQKKINQLNSKKNHLSKQLLSKTAKFEQEVHETVDMLIDKYIMST